MPTTIITPDRAAMRRQYLQPGGVLAIVNGTHTGVAGWTAMSSTVTVPGGILGPSGVTQLDYSFTIDATSTAVWGIRIKFGGTVVWTRNMPNTKGQHTMNRLIGNDGAENSQVYRSASAGIDDTGDNTTPALLTADTSHDVDIVVEANLNAADTARVITLHYCAVRVLGIVGE